VWGGRGTRMDADIEQLLTKWSKRFRPQDWSPFLSWNGSCAW
jgi:hypothetical protein